MALVQICREQSRRFFGMQPPSIILPLDKKQIKNHYQNSNYWGIALANYPGQVSTHYPADKLLQFARTHQFIIPKIMARTPIPQALTIFTDGSSNGRFAYTVNNETIQILSSPTSAQIVELRAVAAVFEAYSNVTFNLYTDSQYIANALPLLETVATIQTANPGIQQLFLQIQTSIHNRAQPCYVFHIRAHSSLPGPLVQGNQQTDSATRIVAPCQVEAARQSHAIHHQNTQSLRKMFKLSREMARQIVCECHHCPIHQNVPTYGINPRNLVPNQIWQIDVTHIPYFGKLQYVHVTIDTYSGFICASALSSEAANQIINHCLKCFTILGVPTVIKTDNGSGYISKHFQLFCDQMQNINWNTI